MMGLIAFWKCVFAAFTIPALGLWKNGGFDNLLPAGSESMFLLAAAAQAVSTWLGLLVIRFEDTAITMVLTCIVAVMIAEQIELADNDMTAADFAKGGAFLLSAVGLFIYVCADRGIEAI